MRVAIAEDSALFRAGLTSLLNAAGVTVCATAADGQELMEQLRQDAPDACILDMRMAPTFTDEGLSTAAALRDLLPQVGILILSTYKVPAYAIRLLQIRDHGVGYLLKDRVNDLQQFVDALDRVQAGESVIDAELVTGMLAEQAKSKLSPLTEREQQVLQLIAEGYSNSGIATRLSLSNRTVETHIARVFDKLNLPDEADHNRRVLATLTWLRTATASA